MTSTVARYGDGNSLATTAVAVTIEADRLQVTGETLPEPILLPLADARITSRIGSVPRFVRFASGAFLEVPADDAFDRALLAAAPRRRLEHVLHALEQHHQFAAAATALVVVAIVACVWFGLPRFARRVAMAVPVSIETEAGRRATRILLPQIGDSQLTQREKLVVHRAEKRLHDARQGRKLPRIVYAPMNVTNAFAMPGGPILVSDSLVKLALENPDGEEMIAAVLAHEISHVERRHGIQLVLRKSTALLVVSAATGDLSTLTAFSSTLPFLLLQNGYSRELETEADDDAVTLLQRANISPESLVKILKALEKQKPTTGPDFNYLSTHPLTDDRVKRIQSLARTGANVSAPATPPKAP